MNRFLNYIKGNCIYCGKKNAVLPFKIGYCSEACACKDGTYSKYFGRIKEPKLFNLSFVKEFIGYEEVFKDR